MQNYLDKAKLKIIQLKIVTSFKSTKIYDVQKID